MGERSGQATVHCTVYRIYPGGADFYGIFPFACTVAIYCIYVCTWGRYFGVYFDRIHHLKIL